MQVVHSFGDGVKHSASLSLREELLPEDLIQQLASPSSAPSPDTRSGPRRTPDTHTHTHLSEPHTAAAAGHQSRVTHVLQRDDVGMLAIPHQDLDLLRRVALAFVNDLFNTRESMTPVTTTPSTDGAHPREHSDNETAFTLIIIKNC